METISKAWDWDKTSNPIWFTPSEESYYLISRWREKGFERFLDLGCGRGRHSIQFAKVGFDVCAADLSETATSGLRESAKKEELSIDTIVCDMLQLPYKDSSFDCMLAYNVISHTDSNGIKTILSEIKRILKDGAEFYITLISKNAWSYQKAGFPRIDDHTVIRIEDGPENNVPHFFVDAAAIKELFADFNLISVKQVQEVIVNGSDYDSWHFFIHGFK